LLYVKTGSTVIHSGYNMQRCLQCDSTMTSAEKVCFACGAAVPDKNPKKGFSERFRMLINGMFIFSVVIALSSILAPSYAPSLWKSFPVLVVLYLVKNSAENMSAMGSSATQTKPATDKKN
jgi:hypothetical protein